MIAPVLWLVVIAAVVAILFGLVRERRQARSIAERSAELEQLSAELYRANRAKSEFLANVSHELRTPLAAIVGFVDLLREGAYGELTPRQIGPVERIESSANHLRLLVEQVLDLAKMAAGRLEVHTELIKLRPFVIDVASEVEPLINEKGLAFSIAVPASLPRIATDPAHLRQILVNLLGNAIKFTASGTITMRAAVVPDGDVTKFAASANKRPLLAAGGSWVALQSRTPGSVSIPRTSSEFSKSSNRSTPVHAVIHSGAAPDLVSRSRVVSPGCSTAISRSRAFPARDRRLRCGFPLTVRKRRGPPAERDSRRPTCRGTVLSSWT
jgi:signal transduction histidine kinase